MDGFFGIGIQELILIAIVALIVLGPERLPATFREIAKFIRQVRNITSEFTQQFGDDFKALEDLDPRRILQRELASIDEEEQAKEDAAKGKSSTTKTTKPTTTTPAKPTPAKATTAKTTTTGKPSTSTSAAKSTTSTKSAATGEASTAPQTDSAPAPATDKSATVATADSQSTSPETQPSGDVTLGESENRIAPSLTPAAQDQSESSAAAATTSIAPSVQANGVVSKDTESTVPSDVITTVAVSTNGVQEHPIIQSE